MEKAGRAGRFDPGGCPPSDDAGSASRGGVRKRLTLRRERSTLAAMTRAVSKDRTKRIAQWAVAAAVVAAALGLLLVKSSPDVYERTAPMGMDREAVRQFDQRVVNHVGNVLLDESGGTPLDLEVTEVMVNARLARFLAQERRLGRAVPPVLAHLRVGFEPGAVVLATRVGRGWSQVVLAQYLRLSADEAGRLCVEPAGASVGVLPMPGGLLDTVRELAAGVFSPQDAQGAPDADEQEQRRRLHEALFDALDGKPVPLGTGERRIVLEAVEVRRGVLRMRGRRARE